jgi:RNA polymerase-binding protein DksA
MLTDTQLAEFRRRLEAERAHLNRLIRSLGGEVEDLADFQGSMEDAGIGNDPADVGTEVYEQERALTMERNEQELLDEVEAALARLDAGEYGTCTRCGREIAVERLEALPYAEHCIQCQSELERRRR